MNALPLPPAPRPVGRKRGGGTPRVPSARLAGGFAGLGLRPEPRPRPPSAFCGCRVPGPCAGLHLAQHVLRRNHIVLGTETVTPLKPGAPLCDRGPSVAVKCGSPAGSLSTGRSPSRQPVWSPCHLSAEPCDVSARGPASALPSASRSAGLPQRCGRLRWARHGPPVLSRSPWESHHGPSTFTADPPPPARPVDDGPARPRGVPLQCPPGGGRASPAEPGAPRPRPRLTHLARGTRRRHGFPPFQHQGGSFALTHVGCRAPDALGRPPRAR